MRNVEMVNAEFIFLGTTSLTKDGVLERLKKLDLDPDGSTHLKKIIKASSKFGVEGLTSGSRVFGALQRIDNFSGKENSEKLTVPTSKSLFFFGE